MFHKSPAPDEVVHVHSDTDNSGHYNGTITITIEQWVISLSHVINTVVHLSGYHSPPLIVQHILYIQLNNV